MSREQPLRVVIADGIPVVRHVMRFFLEEDGFEVLGETARGDELIELARTLQPDAVVLHERLADMAGGRAVPGIREASPSTRIAMSTRSGEVPLSSGTRGADVHLEEGVGLKDLAFVLRTLCESPFITVGATEGDGSEVTPTPGAVGATRIDEEPTRVGIAVARTRSLLDQGRWWARMVAAAAVAITVLSFSLFLPPDGDLTTLPPPGAPSDSESATARIALEQAELQLVSLAEAIEHGAADLEVADLARRLLEARAAAHAAGADLSRLDALIAAELGPMLSGLPPSTTLILRAILGPLIPPRDGMDPGVGPPRDPGQADAEDERTEGGDPGAPSTVASDGSGEPRNGAHGGSGSGSGSGSGDDDGGPGGSGDGSGSGAPGSGDGSGSDGPGSTSPVPEEEPSKNKGKGPKTGDDHPGKGPKTGDDHPGKGPKKTKNGPPEGKGPKQG